MAADPAFIYQVPLTWDRRSEKEQPIETTELLRSDFTQIRDSLRPLFAEKIGSATELSRALLKQKREAFPTTVEPLDKLLHGGLRRGKLIELVGARSSGRFGVVCATLAAATSCGEPAALIDLGDHLDPQFAEAAGIALDLLLWVRPESVKEAVISAEMLMTTGFPLVVIDLGMRVRGRRVDQVAWVRLARTAETHGTALLISSPFPISETAATAVVAMKERKASWLGRRDSIPILTGIASRLILEKHRLLRPGSSEPLSNRTQEVITRGGAGHNVRFLSSGKLPSIQLGNGEEVPKRKKKRTRTSM